MTTQYTTILKLALPVQGELSGTWGDVVNDNITEMVEQAIAGKATIDSWTANAHTLTTADGTTAESRCAILELTDTGTALTGAGTVTCPTNTKLYIVDNNTAEIITVKTSGGTGVAVPVGKTMLVYCDGTNVVEGVTHANSLSLGTSTVTADKILDEDNMASDSATAIATQQSIKAYVDSQVGTVDTLAEILANGNTTGANDIEVDTTQKVQFRDAAIYVNSSVDGQLDIVADGEVQIDTALVDINGNLDVSGTTNISGSTTFTKNAIAGVAISTIARASNTVTVTNSAVHGLTSGDLVNINGVANRSFNGYFTVAVSSTTVFTYSQTGADESSTGGTSTEIVYNLNASGTALNQMNGPLNIAANSGIDGLEITQSGSGEALSITGGNALFGDNDKAIFGIGNDLQIYHNASDSIINDNGTGSLKLQQGGSTKLEVTATGIDVTGTALAHEIEIGDGSAGGTSEILFSDNVSARGKILYDHSSNPETMLLQTTGTTAISIDNSQNVSMPNGNLDVTGSVTADGANIDGAVTTGDLTIDNDDTPTLNFKKAASADILGTINVTTDAGSGGKMVFQTKRNGDTALDRMTINDDGNVGIGNTSPTTALDVSGAVTVTRSDVPNDHSTISNEGGQFAISAATGGGGGTYPMLFKTAATERMRIDSGGSVLIGKSTPTDLHNTWNHLIIGEKGAIISENGAGGIDGITLADNVYIDADTGSYAYQTTAAASQITQSGGVIAFSNAASGSAGAALTPVERMRIDASGNVGIGVVPSAWWTGFEALQLGESAALTGRNGSVEQCNLSSNAVFDLTDVRYEYVMAASNEATLYQQVDGTHRFNTAPAGTAGNPIAFTESMRIDADGDVSIGTSNSLGVLTLKAPASDDQDIITITEDGINQAFSINGNFAGAGSTGNAITLDSFWTDDIIAFRGDGNVGIGTDSPQKTLDVKGTFAISNSTTSYWDFDRDDSDGSLKIADTGSERLRIDASGNLLVGLSSGQDALIHAQAPKATYTDFGTVFAGGTDSHNGKHAISLMSTGDALAGIVGSNLYVDGTSYNQSTTDRSSGYISFNNGTTAGKTSTITFGGLTKGTATALPKMTLDGDGNLLVGTSSTSATSGIGIKIIPDSTAPYVNVVGSASTDSSYGYYQYSTGASAFRFYVGYGGTVFATSTSITAISDASLKENVRDLDKGLETILALQPRRFDWKNGDGNDIMGFVAQEVETVLPELVHDYQYNDEETKLGLKMGDMIPSLVKAIQEQQATIEALTARIAALES